MKLKKILAIVLSGVLALSIVGCGSKGNAFQKMIRKL